MFAEVALPDAERDRAGRFRSPPRVAGRGVACHGRRWAYRWSGCGRRAAAVLLVGCRAERDRSHRAPCTYGPCGERHCLDGRGRRGRPACGVGRLASHATRICEGSIRAQGRRPRFAVSPRVEARSECHLPERLDRPAHSLRRWAIAIPYSTWRSPMARCSSRSMWTWHRWPTRSKMAAQTSPRSCFSTARASTARPLRAGVARQGGTRAAWQRTSGCLESAGFGTGVACNRMPLQLATGGSVTWNDGRRARGTRARPGRWSTMGTAALGPVGGPRALRTHRRRS